MFISRHTIEYKRIIKMQIAKECQKFLLQAIKNLLCNRNIRAISGFRCLPRELVHRIHM